MEPEFDEYDYDQGFDEIESSLLNEDLYTPSKGSLMNGANFGKKLNLSVRVQNDIARSERKGEKRINNCGKDDRATSEQVLDPRTRLILFKLLSNGFLSEIDGCLSTGKEANVYYARGGDGREFAVKIFKTSILVFKDRDKYVSGEYRFRNGYCKSNPRKMVRTWAEKEMRNLKRLQTAGIPAPETHLLKSHVLIMDFLGTDGWCAPRLKDTTLELEQWLECYKAIVVFMRRMYFQCNLVHGDLSEYNILWFRDEPFIIDVSQSVEQSHPLASEFLRKDVSNITEFFTKKGLFHLLSKIDLFQFIVNKNLITNSRTGIENIEEIKNKLNDLLLENVEKISKNINNIENDENNEESELNENYEDINELNQNEEESKKEINEAVFMQTFIPTSLHEIANPQQEMQKIQAGKREPIFAAAIADMLAKSSSEHISSLENPTDHTENPTEEEIEENEEESDDEDCDGDDSGSEFDSDFEDGKYRRQLPSRQDPEERRRQKEARKEACKKAKLERAEKRKVKIPKHVKKRAMKAGKK